MSSVSLSDVGVPFEEGRNFMIGVERNAEHTDGRGCLNLKLEGGREGGRERGRGEGGRKGKEEREEGGREGEK